MDLEAVERQFSSSVRVWSELAGARKVEDRLLGEYHLGLASGIYISLGATGHAKQQERVVRQLGEQHTADEAFLMGLFLGTGLRT